MGLNFCIADYSSKAQWSYSSFHSFRQRIATLVGIELNEMIGFGGSKSWETIKDTIAPFLSHSDCDGDLSPEQCKKIYPRLLELVNMLPDEYINHDKKCGKILAEDMKECAKKGENLIFT